MRTERTTLIIACVALCACGAAVEPSSPAPGPTEPTGETPSTPSPESTPSAPTREGYVVVHTTSGPDGADFTVSGSASFGPKESSSPLTEGCELLADNHEMAPQSDSAGIVDLGVVLGTEKNSLKLDFDQTRKQYEALNASAVGPATGIIHVRARGDVVPMFEADVQALSPTRILSPAANAAIGAGDLALSWTFDEVDRHSIIYFESLTKTVRCYAPTGRELVIPASLVSQVVASNGELRLFILTGRTTSVDAGDYRVSVSHNTSTHVELTRQ